MILADVNPEDYKDITTKEITANILKNTKNGSIICLHDHFYYIQNSNNTLESLKIIIPELKKRGFKFVTVSELLKE
jgi:peptidoglycan/xylan/chitin deacetylase (PgdA/CDA1 family)